MTKMCWSLRGLRRRRMYFAAYMRIFQHFYALVGGKARHKGCGQPRLPHRGRLARALLEHGPYHVNAIFYAHQVAGSV